MIGEMIGALQAGKELQNAETWKNIQTTTNAVAAIAGGVVSALSLVGVHIHATPEQLHAVYAGIAGVLGIVNGYLTVATSARVGVQAGGASAAQPGVPTGGDGP